MNWFLDFALKWSSALSQKGASSQVVNLRNTFEHSLTLIRLNTRCDWIFWATRWKLPPSSMYYSYLKLFPKNKICSHNAMVPTPQLLPDKEKPPRRSAALLTGRCYFLTKHELPHVRIDQRDTVNSGHRHACAPAHFHFGIEGWKVSDDTTR